MLAFFKEDRLMYGMSRVVKHSLSESQTKDFKTILDNCLAFFCSSQGIRTNRYSIAFKKVSTDLKPIEKAITQNYWATFLKVVVFPINGRIGNNGVTCQCSIWTRNNKPCIRVLSVIAFSQIRNVQAQNPERVLEFLAGNGVLFSSSTVISRPPGSVKPFNEKTVY
jgi:hypothetical protein